MRFTLLCLLSARCGGLAVGRRAFFASSVGGACLMSKARTAAAEDPVSAPSAAPAAVVKSVTGVEWRDVHVGGGAALKNGDVVVLQVRGLLPDVRRQDDSVFLDTVKDGRPLLHQMGTAGPSLAAVTVGLEEALETMRLGGRRLVVVPPEMAYAERGVGRYDARRIGLRRLVPRGELLRYEVELLRCVEVPSGIGEACCSDEAYPCPSPPSSKDAAS